MNTRGYRGRGFRPRGFHHNNFGNSFNNGPQNQRFTHPNFGQQNPNWQGRPPFQQTWPQNRTNQYSPQCHPPLMGHFNSPSGMPNHPQNMSQHPPSNMSQHPPPNFSPMNFPPLCNNNSGFVQNPFRGPQPLAPPNPLQLLKETPLTGNEVERQKEMSKTLDLIKGALSTASEKEKQSWEKDLSLVETVKFEDDTILPKDGIPEPNHGPPGIQLTSHDSKVIGRANEEDLSDRKKICDSKKEEGRKVEQTRSEAKQRNCNIADTGQPYRKVPSKPTQMPGIELSTQQKKNTRPTFDNKLKPQNTHCLYTKNQNHQTTGVSTSANVTKKVEPSTAKAKTSMAHDEPLRNAPNQMGLLTTSSDFRFVSPQLNKNTFYQPYSPRQLPDLSQCVPNNFPNAQPNLVCRDMPNYTPYGTNESESYSMNNLQPPMAFDPRIGALERATMFAQSQMEVTPMPMQEGYHMPMMPMPPAGFMMNNPVNYPMPLPAGPCPSPYIAPTICLTQPQEQPLLPPPPPAGSPPPGASLLLGQQLSLDDCLQDGWKDMQDAMAFASQSINMIPDSTSPGKKKKKKKRKTSGVENLMIAIPDDPVDTAPLSNIQKKEVVEKHRVTFNLPPAIVLPRPVVLKQQVVDDNKRRSSKEEFKPGKLKEKLDKIAPKELASSMEVQKTEMLQCKTPPVRSETRKEPATTSSKNTPRVSPIKLKKVPRSATDEARWKDNIFNRFKEMSRNGICNIINNEGRKKFDIPMQHLVKETRSSLSLEMRNSQDEKVQIYENLPAEFMSTLQAMLKPSATIDIDNIDIKNLPNDFVHHLNTFLGLGDALFLNENVKTEKQMEDKKVVVENIERPKNQTSCEKSGENSQHPKTSQKSSSGEASKQPKSVVEGPNCSVSKCGQPASKSGKPVSAVSQPVSRTGQPASKTAKQESEAGKKKHQKIIAAPQPKEQRKVVAPHNKIVAAPHLKEQQKVLAPHHKIVAAPQPKEQQKVVAPLTASTSGNVTESAKHQAVASSVDLSESRSKSLENPTSEKSQHPEKIVASALDDLFPGGLLKSRAPVQSPLQNSKVSASHSSKSTSVTINKTQSNSDSRKDSIMAKYEKSQVDVDDIFSAGIAKAKLAKNSSAMDRKSKEESKVSQPESEAMHFRNLTKEEWDARHGKSSSHRQHYLDNDGKNCSASPLDYVSPADHASIGRKHRVLGQTNEEATNWVGKETRKTLNEDEDDSSSDSDSSSDDSSVDGGKNSESSSNDKCRRLLKIIKERESIAKNKSLNETIRDEVTAEIERKRKEQGKRKKKDKRSTSRKKYSKIEKKKSAKKYKRYVSPERKKEETNSSKVHKLLAENEIKKEIIDEPVPETVAKASSAPVSKHTSRILKSENLVSKVKTPSKLIAHSGIREEAACEISKLNKSSISKPKVNANHKKVSPSISTPNVKKVAFSVGTEKELKNAAKSKSDEEGKSKNVSSDQMLTKTVKRDNSNKIHDNAVNGMEVTDQNTKQLDTSLLKGVLNDETSMANEQMSSITENPTLLTQDLLCIPILKRSVENLPRNHHGEKLGFSKDDASDFVTPKKPVFCLDRLSWSNSLKNSKKSDSDTINSTQSDEASNKKSENGSDGQNIQTNTEDYRKSSVSKEVNSSSKNKDRREDCKEESKNVEKSANKGKVEEPGKDSTFSSSVLSSDELNEDANTTSETLVKKGQKAKIKEKQVEVESASTKASKEKSCAMEDVTKEKCDADVEKIVEIIEENAECEEPLKSGKCKEPWESVECEEPWKNVGFEESWKDADAASTPDVAKGFPEEFKNPSPEGYVQDNVAAEVQPEILQYPEKSTDEISENSAKESKDDIAENHLEVASTNGALSDIIQNSEIIEMDAPLLDEIARVSLTTLEKNDSMMPDDVNFNEPLELLDNCKEFDMTDLELEDMDKKQASDVVYNDSINCNSLRIDDPLLKTNLKEDEEIIDMSLRSVSSPFKDFPPESISCSPYLHKPFFNLELDELSYDGAIDTSNVNIDDNLDLVENVDAALLTPLLLDSLKILSNNEENNIAPEFFESMDSKSAQKTDEKVAEKNDSDVETIATLEQNQFVEDPELKPVDVSSSTAPHCNDGGTEKAIPRGDSTDPQKQSLDSKSIKPKGESKTHSKKSSKVVKTDKGNECQDVKKDKSIKKDGVSRTRNAAMGSSSPAVKNQLNEELMPLFSVVDVIHSRNKSKPCPSIEKDKNSEKKTTKKHLPKEQDPRKVTKKSELEKDAKENSVEVTTTAEEINDSSSDKKDVPVVPIIARKKINDQILHVIQQAPVVVLEKSKDLDELAKDRVIEHDSSAKKDSQRSKEDKALHKVKKKHKKEKKSRFSEKEMKEIIAESSGKVVKSNPNTREWAMKRMLEIDIEVHKLVSEKLSLYELLHGGALLSQNEKIETATDDNSEVTKKTDNIEQNKETDSSATKNTLSQKVESKKEEKAEEAEKSESKKNSCHKSKKEHEGSTRKKHSSQKKEKGANDAETSSRKSVHKKRDKEHGDTEESTSKKTSHHKKVDSGSSDKRKSRSKSKSHDVPSTTTTEKQENAVTKVSSTQNEVEKVESEGTKIPPSSVKKDNDGDKKSKKSNKTKDGAEEKKSLHNKVLIEDSDSDIDVVEDKTSSKSSYKRSKVRENNPKKRLRIYSDESSSDSEMSKQSTSKKPSGLMLLVESLHETRKHEVKNQDCKKKRRRIEDTSDDSDAMPQKIPRSEKKQSKTRNDSSKKKTTKTTVDNGTVMKHIDEAIEAAVKVVSQDSEDVQKQVEAYDVPVPVSSPIAPHDTGKMEDEDRIIEVIEKSEAGEEDRMDKKLPKDSEVVNDIFLSSDSRGSGDNAVDFNLLSVKIHTLQSIDLPSKAEEEADELDGDRNNTKDVDDEGIDTHTQLEFEDDKTNDSYKSNKSNQQSKNRKVVTRHMLSETMSEKDEISAHFLPFTVAHDQNSNSSISSLGSTRSSSRQRNKKKEKLSNLVHGNLSMPVTVDISGKRAVKKKKAMSVSEMKNCEVALVDIKYTYLCPYSSMGYLEKAGLSRVNNLPHSETSYVRSRPTSANKESLLCDKVGNEVLKEVEVQPEVQSTSTGEEAMDTRGTEKNSKARLEIPAPHLRHGKEVKKSSKITQYTSHMGPILHIQVFEDSFLAASEDGNIYRYCLTTDKLLHTYEGHTNAVTCLCIPSVLSNPDSTKGWVYSGSLDSTLRCFDIQSGAEVQNVATIQSPIQCMELGWGTIFIGTKSGHIARYMTKNGTIKDEEFSFVNKPVLALKTTNEGMRKVLVVAARNQAITIRDAQTGLYLRSISGNTHYTVYSLLRNHGHIFCGTSTTSIPVFDFTTGEEKFQYNAGVGIVCMCLYEQSLLFAGCYDGNIYVFDIKKQEIICSMPGPGNMLLSLEVVNRKVIAGSKDKHLHLWDMPEVILKALDCES